MPINIAYNHHHGVSINGKGARMETVDRAEAEAAGLRGLKLSELLDQATARCPEPCAETEL